MTIGPASLETQTHTLIGLGSRRVRPYPSDTMRPGPRRIRIGEVTRLTDPAAYPPGCER